jgi:hypothetical protein
MATPDSFQLHESLNVRGNMIFDEFRKLRKWEKCNCKSLQGYSDEINCPIRYDSELDEDNIVYGTHRIIMYYCFFCGGKLPKSKRGNLCTKPSKTESAKAFNLIRKIKTEKDLIEILGMPDKKISNEDFPDLDKNNQSFPKGWKSHFDYHSKWKTLEIHFQIYDNGNVEGSVCGKYLGRTDSNQEATGNLAPPDTRA